MKDMGTSSSWCKASAYVNTYVGRERFTVKNLVDISISLTVLKFRKL